MKTFVIKYEIWFKDGSKVLNKEMKVKNCMSSVHAQVKLEEYLAKKHGDFDRLVVESCQEDIFSTFGDIFGANFNDIFSGKH